MGFAEREEKSGEQSGEQSNHGRSLIEIPTTY